MKRYDVVVVGAGPTGMLLWESLTEAGLCVLLIDAGPHRRPHQDPQPDDTRRWAYETADGSPLLWRRVHAVGGRTLGWGGFCHRFPQVVFDDGLWPYGASTLAPDYATVERWLNMAEGSVSAEHSAAAHRLGWTFVPLRGARVDGRVWTALDARGAGAVNANSVAVEFDCDRHKARSLRVLGADGQESWVAAQAFALAAGPIESARLLLASRFGEAAPQIGQGMVDHLTVGWMLLEPLRRTGLSGRHRREPLISESRRPGSLHSGSLRLEGALVPRFVNLGQASQRPYRGGFSIEITGPQALAEMPAIAAELGIAPSDAQGLRVTFINAM